MGVCNICGAPDVGLRCRYDVGLHEAPWSGDYQAIHEGRMSHAQHSLVVARWGLHSPAEHPEKAKTRFEELARLHWGECDPP